MIPAKWNRDYDNARSRNLPHETALGGFVRKGGRNVGLSQVASRPPPPGAMTMQKVMADPHTAGGVGSTSVPWATECGCLTCQEDRRLKVRAAGGDIFSVIPGTDPHFRFACEICGNKRCPHHTDHNLTCTNSNAVGQPGSAYQ